MSGRARLGAALLVLAAVPASAAGAREWDGNPPAVGEPRVVLTPWIGYGAAALHDVREAWGVTGPALTGGVVVGLDGGVRVSRALHGLVRTGYRSAGRAVRVSRAVSDFDFGPLGTLHTVEDERHTIAASAVPVLAGVRFVQTVQQIVTVSFGVFGGAGFGRLAFSYDDVTVDTGTGAFAGTTTSRIRGTIPLAGTGLAAEALFGVAWRFSDAVSAGLEGGYHSLRVGTMKVTRDVDLTGDGVADVEAGDRLEDANGDPLPADFSGATVAVRLTIAF